jgi:hypothetical protein
MTNPFTSADVDNMREAQGIHAYTDRAAYIPAPDLTNLDEYGQPAVSAVEITIDCAFVDQAKRENWREADIEQLDAEIYFSAVTPTKGGNIKVLSRFGQPVTEQTFEITGIQDRGTFGWVCALRAVTL